MRIIVHFGMPKTGSSSIQRTLYKNSSNLNICYPNFNAVHNDVLYSAFHERPSNSLSEKRNHVAASALLKLKTELELNLRKHQDVLLSAEILTLFNFNELQSLYALLSSYTNEIIAVGYIRPPKAYIESFFQQNAKNPRKMKIKSFNLGLRFPFYQTFFEKFDQLFGKENTFFWKFDPASFPNGCVVSDFCQRLKIDIAADAIERVNEGLSLEAVSLLYAYSRYAKELNLASPTAKEDKRLLINLLSKLHGRKLHFSSEIIAPILDANRHHIEWMETRMGVSLAERLAKDDQNAIHSEAELLTVTPETIQWLAEQLGTDYINRWHPDMSVKEIAEWVHLLLLKLAAQKQAKEHVLANKINRKTSLSKLIEQAKKEHADLAGMSDENADLLLREVFKQITNEIENKDEGLLNIAGLGRFKIRKINKTRGKQRMTTKRIIFERSKDKIILPE